MDPLRDKLSAIAINRKLCTPMKDAEMNLDLAFEKATEILSLAALNIDNIRSEEDAKIQIITRLLVEALGWLHSDIKAENHHENGFSDYILTANDKPVVLVEAKRVGRVDINTADASKRRNLKISGPGLKNALPGINQAYSYAGPNGIPVAVLTDGVSWVVFKPYIPGENYKNKEAIVFPSFDAILDEFSLFFDLLSKQQVKQRIYSTVFDQVHQNRLLLSNDLIPAIRKDDIHVVQREDISFDLDKVFERYFSRLTGDADEQLLIDCFVETRESRIADFSLEKITSSILGNLTPASKDVDQELALLISDTVEDETDVSEAGSTVFIVGPTGAGKTTFLSRFFSRTLPLPVRKRCAVLRINFLDATGTNETSLQWLTERMISELEADLYRNGTPTWDELQGLYHSDYQRRATGVDSVLYQRDKPRFKEKFGEFLDDRVENDREGYLKRMLEDAVLNRNKLPIIVIDNTDEFPPDFKDQIFQFAQSLRRHINHCLIVFPMTDKSAWSFSNRDIYSIYRSRSFFLPTPPPREVFRKRIDYLKKMVEAEDSKGASAEYSAGKGLRISIEDMSKFAKILENVFVEHDYASKTIGEISNYNIRRTLALSQRVITSPVFKVGDLLKSYITGEPIAPSFAKFMNALLKGEFQLYRAGEGNEIYPVFQSDFEIRQSPLLVPRILSLLEAAKLGSRNIDERHVVLESIFAYFDALGCSESAINRSLISQIGAGLIEPFDMSNMTLSPDQKLAITSKGSAHLRLATTNNVFFEQMALTTAIFDEEKSALIRDEWRASKSLPEKMPNIRRMFLEYLLNEDMQLISTAVAGGQYESQERLLELLKRFDRRKPLDEGEQIAALGKEFELGMGATEVTATVDWFDIDKGFGFVDINGFDFKAFVHLERAQEIGVESISDGDQFLCDVIRKPKGMTVSKIHSFNEDHEGTTILDCKIVRLYKDRGYGFVGLDGSLRDAFFHFSIIPESERENLSLGQVFRCAVCPDPKGRGWQVKRVVSL